MAKALRKNFCIPVDMFYRASALAPNTEIFTEERPGITEALRLTCGDAATGWRMGLRHVKVLLSKKLTFKSNCKSDQSGA